ncbi:MAG TPA: hypothetical protein VM452_17510 [Caulifigura sp.]|nr:hypothetical protein [Caulifigura sp.]
MKRSSHRWASATVVLAVAGCSPSVPLAPPPPFNPIAMQIAPGPGFSLAGVQTVYLVVNAIDAKNREVLPNLAEVISGELRAATAAPVILQVENGLDCPPPAEWTETCRVCELPSSGLSPAAVVVFCDLLEYDPYMPLRVSMSVRVRRATDGLELVAMQGTWLGAPPITPQRRPFHWLYKKGPPRPNVEFAWTAQYEAQSGTQLVRHAARQCVETLVTSNGHAPHAMAPLGPPPSHHDMMPPPAPPALPDPEPPPASNPIPEATSTVMPPVTESGSSVPEESHPSQ